MVAASTQPPDSVRGGPPSSGGRAHRARRAPARSGPRARPSTGGRDPGTCRGSGRALARPGSCGVEETPGRPALRLADVPEDAVCVVLHANRIEAVPPQRIPYYPLMPGLAYWRKETKRPYRLTLVLRSLASGSERSVPTEFIDTAGVSWSADSLSLLLSAQVPDGWGYYRIDPSSGTATLLRLKTAK